MGRPTERESRFLGLVLSALFMTCLIPFASAAGGGGVIDVSSFSLTDYETTEFDTYELHFDIVELLSNDADIEVQVELSSFDGNLGTHKITIMNRYISSIGAVIIDTGKQNLTF